MASEPGTMMLGDNIFYGNGFRTMLKAAIRNAEAERRATVIGYYVPDPERFGVVEYDEKICWSLRSCMERTRMAHT